MTDSINLDTPNTDSVSVPEGTNIEVEPNDLTETEEGTATDNSSNETIDSKRKRGLGDKNYISYHIPWILYFYPDPKADPNYILLNPEKDKDVLNRKKTQILTIISMATFFGILYSFWVSGVLFPAIHTIWFFLWRYITLIIFFLIFSIVIAILRGFPYFIRKINHYAKLTYNPSLFLHKRPWYDKKAQWIRYTLRGLFRFIFGLATVAWTGLLILVMLPLFAIFATICGLLLGDLNRTYFAFGMAEYEVTELEKKSLQKRIENKMGITNAKSYLSDKITNIDSKTGLSSKMEQVKEMLKKIPENPFLKS